MKLSSLFIQSCLAFFLPMCLPQLSHGAGVIVVEESAGLSVAHLDALKAAHGMAMDRNIHLLVARGRQGDEWGKESRKLAISFERQSGALERDPTDDAVSYIDSALAELGEITQALVSYSAKTAWGETLCLIGVHPRVSLAGSLTLAVGKIDGVNEDNFGKLVLLHEFAHCVDTAMGFSDLKSKHDRAEKGYEPGSKKFLQEMLRQEAFADVFALLALGRHGLSMAVPSALGEWRQIGLDRDGDIAHYSTPILKCGFPEAGSVDDRDDLALAAAEIVNKCMMSETVFTAILNNAARPRGEHMPERDALRSDAKISR